MPIVTVDQAVAIAAEHHKAGRRDQAADIYRQVLASEPQQPDALHLLGLVERHHGRLDVAVELMCRALALRPDFFSAWYNLANVYRDGKNYPAALQALHYALVCHPYYLDAYKSRANLLWHMARYAEAIRDYQAVIALDPLHTEAHFDMGVSYQKLGELEQARNAFAMVTSYAYDYATAFNSLGNVLRDLGDAEAAVPLHQRALALEPEFHEARKCLAISWLTAGNYRDGFRAYEGRRFVPDGYTRAFPRPEWAGEALAGARLLIHCEQGLGDTLHFIRYAAEAKRLGGAGQVIFGCPTALVRLLAGAEGVDAIVPVGGILPDFDVHLPLLSLPHVLGTTLATVPAQVPYVRVPPEALAQWQDRLGPAQGRLRVGLCWAGNADYGADRSRSLRLEMLLPLLSIPGTEICAVQMGDGRRDLDAKAWIPPAHFRDFGPEITDFADTAAILNGMDLVIAVDTSVAHLAGALARPVWIFLPTNSDWRWLKDRDDSPWYPTARLFRQSRRGDWSDVIVRMTEALKIRTQQAT